MMKLLTLTSDLLARITLTLISFFANTGCSQKVNFQLPLHCCMLYELFKKWAVLCRNNSVFLKIRDNLLCVTNRCIKVLAN